MTPEQLVLAVAYKRVFASDDGVMVLADLKRKSTINRSSISGGQAILANKLIWDEAQRSMVLYIVGRVEANLDEVKPKTAQTEEKTDG